MTTILALDTSTDACSVAFLKDGQLQSRFELVPREHNHRLFAMLKSLFPDGVAGAGIELVAFAEGPGSFTGLRVAASAVQGLAFTLDIPVAGVSSLACIAQGAYRRAEINADETALVLLDARINEIYGGLYRLQDGKVVACMDDFVSAPAEVNSELLSGVHSVVAMGSGLTMLDQLPASVRSGIARSLDDLWPDSIDLLPLAVDAAAAGRLLDAKAVQPVYLRNEVHWKKLAEQGPQGG